MSKRNISYVKPQDPSFLAKLKAQIGFKEGPTVEAKRQKIEEDDYSDSGEEERPEREDEKPQIVVLRSGDLDAEQVAQEEKRIAREIAEAPADLNQRIIFNKHQHKAKDTTTVASNTATTAKTAATTTTTTAVNESNAKSTKTIEKSTKKDKSKKQQKQQQQNNKLSFNNNDDDDEEEKV